MLVRIAIKRWMIELVDQRFVFGYKRDRMLYIFTNRVVR